MKPKVNKHYQRLRARLIERGTNLRRFAIENGYPLMTVYSAARGDRRGIRSMQVRQQLKDIVK